ncbi:MAG: hypothetical protein RBR77_04225 [Thauera sp.]|jgi:hypothetical protein|nr:hypothetical protein [Thauera sp.]
MSIKQYIHGQDDYALWGHVGRLIVDRDVQQYLGGDINSHTGDVWLVMLTHNKRTVGFAAARLLKSGALHLRYFYHDDHGALGEETLVRRAISYAVEQGCKSIHTNWRKDSEMLAGLGFTAEPRARGLFCRWEKNLEEKQA